MGTSSSKIALIAALSTLWPGIALPQQGSVGASQAPTSGPATTTPTTTVSTGTTPAAAGTTIATPISIPITTATSTAAGAATGNTAPGTTRPGGLQVDINVNSTLTVDDNFQLNTVSSGTSTIFDNTVGVDLSSVTAIQDFNLNATGIFRFADFPGRSVSGFEDPTIRFSYQRDGVNSQLTLDGLFREVDREFLDPFQVAQEQILSNAFIKDGGTLTQKNFGLIYRTGINDPLSFTLAADHKEDNYANVTDPLLFDTKTDTVSATARLKVSPVTTARIGAGIDDYSAEDSVQTQRQTVDYFVGVTQDINPVLTLDAQVGWSEVETDTINGTTSQSDAIGTATLRQTLANGSVFASFDSSLNQNGTTNTLRFGRDLQLPRGTFSATIGGANSPSGDTHVIGSLAYSHQMRTSDITVSLNRAVSTNNLNADVVNTRLAIDYGYAIDSNSRFDVTLNWAKQESAGIGNAATIERTSLRAAYSRALTRDWDLTGGIVLRDLSDSSVAGDARSNAVFLTLGRSFSFRP